MRGVSVFVALLALAAAPFAQAQAPQGTPMNIRGTVAKLDGQSLTVKTADGRVAVITLAPNYMVRTSVKKKLTDIHPGDFVGSTSVPGDDGKLHAVEVHFFPANVPIPDSQYAWDLQPGSLMTNAHVTGIAQGAGGSDPVRRLQERHGASDRRSKDANRGTRARRARRPETRQGGLHHRPESARWQPLRALRRRSRKTASSRRCRLSAAG